jgi:hypothetical protein
VTTWNCILPFGRERESIHRLGSKNKCTEAKRILKPCCSKLIKYFLRSFLLPVKRHDDSSIMYSTHKKAIL